MRVITGTARGRSLRTLPGPDVRPTPEKVKEAIFSSIHFSLEGARFLDLFCGSGQMGIEALSRGARQCVFVDQARDSVEITRQNLAAAELDARGRVVLAEASVFLRGLSLQVFLEKFDFVFLDPPYSRGLPQEILPLLPRVLQETGLVLCEHATSDSVPDRAGELARMKTYRYGRVSVSAYRRASEL